jgi:predicted N-acetyltransferase YhbS
LKISQEKPEKFREIYNLVKVAFQTAKVSNGKEQDFTDELRAGGNYIPELALVAEENGKLIGHIMLTRSYVTEGSNKFEMLLLAPISVVLEQRGKGVGSKLIAESFRLARAKGYRAVILVGDPGYYHRFGFKAAIEFGIKHVHDIPDENVMACELVPGGLSGVSGTTDCC